LTRKIPKYEWTEKCEEAFQELKKRFASVPILALPTADQVFLQVSLIKGVARFGKAGKLHPRYIGPYLVVQRVGVAT